MPGCFRAALPARDEKDRRHWCFPGPWGQKKLLINLDCLRTIPYTRRAAGTTLDPLNSFPNRVHCEGMSEPLISTPAPVIEEKNLAKACHFCGRPSNPEDLTTPP